MATAMATVEDRRPTHRSGAGLPGAVVWTVATVAALFDALMIFNITTGLYLANALAGDTATRQPLSALPQLHQAELAAGETGDLTGLALPWRVLCATPTFINLMTIVASATLIVGIMVGIRAGRPFNPRSQRSWRVLAVVLVAGGVLQAVVDTVAAWALLALMDAQRSTSSPLGARYSGLSAFPNWPWSLIVLGAIAWAMAQAFTQGAQLAEEAAGVV